MAYEQRSYSGNAPPTTLSSGLTASGLTISVVDGTGYPNGDDGPFYIVIDPETALEEKVLVASRSGNSFTVATVAERGADSTTQQAHGSGAVVQHVHSATDAREANQGVVQGIGRVTSKGDLVVGTGVRATARLAVGATSNDALVIDPAQTTGVKWGKAAPTEHNHAPGQGGNIPTSSVAGLQGHFDTTSTHGVEGEIVGTNDTQTLTNKTLTGSILTGASISSSSLTSPTLLTPTINDPLTNYGTRRMARPLTGTSTQRATYAPVYDGDTWYETDLNRVYLRRQGAWLLQSPKPYFHVYRNAAASVAGGVWTGFDFDTVDKDNWGLFNNSNNRFYCPFDGYYEFTAAMHINIAAAATLIATALFWYDPAGVGPNIWAQDSGAVIQGQTVGYSASVTKAAWFQSGCSIYAAVYQNYSGFQGLATESYVCWFQGQLVEAGPPT